MATDLMCCSWTTETNDSNPAAMAEIREALRQCSLVGKLRMKRLGPSTPVSKAQTSPSLILP